MTHFSGSYLASDVEFLLQKLHIPTVDVLEKERLIQTGQKHYSQMLSEEPRPLCIASTTLSTSLSQW
jgi:hypothetical protein